MSLTTTPSGNILCYPRSPYHVVLAGLDQYVPLLRQLLKILKDYETMIELCKEYSGKLDSGFAVGTVTKFRMLLEHDLSVIASEVVECDIFYDHTLGPTFKLFCASLKRAIQGDFSDLDVRVVELKEACLGMAKVLKSSAAHSDDFYSSPSKPVNLSAEANIAAGTNPANTSSPRPKPALLKASNRSSSFPVRPPKRPPSSPASPTTSPSPSLNSLPSLVEDESVTSPGGGGREGEGGGAGEGAGAVGTPAVLNLSSMLGSFMITSPPPNNPPSRLPGSTTTTNTTPALRASNNTPTVGSSITHNIVMSTPSTNASSSVRGSNNNNTPTVAPINTPATATQSTNTPNLSNRAPPSNSARIPMVRAATSTHIPRPQKPGAIGGSQLVSPPPRGTSASTPVSTPATTASAVPSTPDANDMIEDTSALPADVSLVVGPITKQAAAVGRIEAEKRVTPQKKKAPPLDRSVSVPSIVPGTTSGTGEKKRSMAIAMMDASKKAELLEKYGVSEILSMKSNMHQFMDKVDSELEERRKKLDSALKSACETGDMEKFERIISSPAFVPDAHPHLFVYVCSNNQLAMLKRLMMDRRIDPSAYDNIAVKIAQRKGFGEMESLLMKDSRVRESLPPPVEMDGL